MSNWPAGFRVYPSPSPAPEPAGSPTRLPRHSMPCGLLVRTVPSWTGVGGAPATGGRGGGGAVRGLAVHAAGNGPGVHGLWPQALALGYRVVVRPSRREPLTGHRLVNALRQAGFCNQDAVYLPADHG